MIYTYPTLSMLPTYPLDESYEDFTIRTEYEAGYEHTRPKFSDDARKTFSLKYIYLSNADKALLDAFINTVNTDISFVWTHPQSWDSYLVRFNSVPSFSYTTLSKWSCDFDLSIVLLTFYESRTSSVWMYINDTWTQIANTEPSSLVYVDRYLYGDFDTNGVYRYDNTGTTWTQISTYNPTRMMKVNNLLYGDFSGSGVWYWNNDTGSWLQDLGGWPE